ncbi:MAG: hypothetical protein ACRC62_35785 [Microcoleus sp.]
MIPPQKISTVNRQLSIKKLSTVNCQLPRAGTGAPPLPVNYQL